MEVHSSCTVATWLGEFWALLYQNVRWVQLCSSLNILWHCLSLGLEWKLTLSSPMATAGFSKFAGILSAALSHHHLLGFEITQREFHHLHKLCSQWCFLRPTWPCIPGCLALGEWSHHYDYLGHEDFLGSSSVHSCHLFLISSASVRCIPFLSFIVPIFAWNVPLIALIFLNRSLDFPILLSSSIYLHWFLWKAFLSLLAILWNSAFKCYIFPFLLCLSLLFFSQLFVRPSQTIILPFCISFS